MKIAAVDKTLRWLAELIGQRGFEERDTDTLEIKSVPADSLGGRSGTKACMRSLSVECSLRDW
jgi:hypothetical protein